MPNRMMLLLLVVLCAALVECKRMPDSYCYDDEKGEKVLAEDCPHCCLSDNCGTQNECENALIIGISVAGGFLLCAFIIAMVVLAYVNDKACFAPRKDPTTNTAPEEDVAPDEEKQQHPTSNEPVV